MLFSRFSRSGFASQGFYRSLQVFQGSGHPVTHEFFYYLCDCVQISLNCSNRIQNNDGNITVHIVAEGSYPPCQKFSDPPPLPNPSKHWKGVPIVVYFWLKDFSKYVSSEVSGNIKQWKMHLKFIFKMSATIVKLVLIKSLFFCKLFGHAEQLNDWWS